MFSFDKTRVRLSLAETRAYQKALGLTTWRAQAVLRAVDGIVELDYYVDRRGGKPYANEAETHIDNFDDNV